MIINLTGNYPTGDNIWKKETIFLSESLNDLIVTKSFIKAR